jgi:outer membrane lipoprotein-sorting protein
MLGLLGLLWPLWMVGQTPDAAEVVRKSEENLRGLSNRATLSITIVRPTWTRQIKARTWAKGSEYSMIVIDAPARDRGTVFLKRKNEIWNYVPSIERNIKLPPSMMAQSWMGSDFKNDDLVQESSLVRDYTKKHLGFETISGKKCHKIEFTPLPDAPVVWGKLLAWISDGDWLQLRVEFYDEDGEKVSVLEGMDVRTLGNRTLPSRLRMTPLDKAGHYTEMKYDELEFGVALDTDYFTPQNMTRIR